MIKPTSLFLFLLSGMLSAQTIVPAGFGAMSANQSSRETAVLTGILNSTGGQNPTVKIRWGDEDRGTAVTPSTAWDNEITISTNQAAGTFSTTITIPNLEKVYYFRAIASNSGGYSSQPKPGCASAICTGWRGQFAGPVEFRQ